MKRPLSQRTNLEHCSASIDNLIQTYGIEVFLQSAAESLRKSDPSAAGETGRQLAKILDILAELGW